VKVTREKTEDSQAFLTVEMEPSEVEESLAGAYQRLAKKTSVPGFRKGKTPRDVLERYLGRESILDEALQQLLPQAYAKALEEQEIEPVAQPRIEVTQYDPVIFKAVVPMAPTVTLGDYHSIKEEPEPVEITEEQTNAVMEELRHQHSTWEPVERTVNPGDMVTFDIEGNVEGEQLVNRQGAQYQVIEGSSSPAPGFAEQIVGTGKGEEKEFQLTLPEDYFKSELGNKEATFKVKIIEIKQEILPEVNDELAKLVSPEFETLAILQEEITKNMRLRAEEKAKADFEERVIAAVVDQSQVEFPSVMVDAEVDRIFREQMNRMQMTEKGLEAYLKSINKTEAELQEELRPAASKRVASSLVLGKVIEAENIEVADDEIDAEIERMINSPAGETTPEKKEKLKEFLDTPQTRESIKQSFTVRKAIEKLTDIAKGSDEAQSKGKEKEK